MIAKRIVEGLIVLAVLYFGVTGYAGYMVGKGIVDARGQSVWMRIGSDVLGRRATERIALRQANLPVIITSSPTFWMMLRQSE